MASVAIPVLFLVGCVLYDHYTTYSTSRLNKELETLNKNLDGYARKLGNESFVAKAPAKVVAEEKRRQAEALENKAKVEEALARIANF